MLTVLVDENLDPAQLPENASRRMVAGRPAQIADQVRARRCLTSASTG